MSQTLERSWERAVANEPVESIDGGVRSVIVRSWERSRGAGVSAALRRAPRVLDDDQLQLLRHDIEWLRFTAPHLHRDSTAPGHIVAFFDTSGHMIGLAGDDRICEMATDVNFAPGGLWTEAAVGTNGPGTALATESPVYIVGAEHYCEAWHRWHCAAAPLRDPSTGRIVGAIDVSGNAAAAAPHAQTLHLVRMMAAAIETALHNAALQRRVVLFESFLAAASRYATERISVIDLAGVVVAASAGAPAGWRSGDVVPSLRPSELRALDGAAGHGAHLPDEAIEMSPIVVRGEPIGACVVFAGAPRTARAAARSARAVPPRAATRYTFDDLVGDSPALVAARELAIAASRSDLPVLLLGESGVGKEVVAQSIHAASARASEPFVAVNCGAIPSSLVESELFGYAPGTFTGGLRQGAAGKFEAAEGGTIFLDEVGELPLSAQVALLRVLQEGEVTRLGDTRACPVDVRIIAATNRPIADALAAGTLRRDVYYRLAVLTCELPPLRERLSDLPRLIERFVDEARREVRRPDVRLAPDVEAALRAYPWPGNVRELKNVIRRAVGVAARSEVTCDDLPPELRACAAPPAANTGLTAEATELARLRQVIATAPSMSAAAAALGMSRATLYRHLARYGMRAGRTLTKARS